MLIYLILKYILIVPFVIFLGIFLYTYWKHQTWKRLGIPYEKPFPIIGNLSFLMRKSFTDYFYELGQKYKGKPYVGVYLGHKPVLLLQSPELCRNILVRDSQNFEDRYCYANKKTDPLGAYNLFVSKNPIWTSIRRECSPMFTSSRLKKISELMNLNAKEAVKRIDRELKQGKDVETKELFFMYTSDTVAYTVFGLRLSTLSGEDSPLWVIAQHMFKWTFKRGLEFTLMFYVPIFTYLSGITFFSKGATEYVRNMFWEVANERIKNNIQHEKDLVGVLLSLKEKMKLPAEGDPVLCDNLMLAQAAVFIFGAVDTSSTTLSYSLHELAYHQKEQQQLYDEISGALKATGKEYLDFEELLELKYLTCCILETLRKHPPVPNLDRIALEDYKVDDKLTLEKGSPIYINLQALHYNEKYWPEPHEWRPERFSGDNEFDNRQYTFLPFGDGPRFCIGKRYGMIQVRVALAQIIAKYKIEPHPDQPYIVKSDPYSGLLAPKLGGLVKFIPRD